jgi:hypothetical protein
VKDEQDIWTSLRGQLQGHPELRQQSLMGGSGPASASGVSRALSTGGVLERDTALRHSQYMTASATPLSVYQPRTALRGISPLIYGGVIG